jgi:hypothetical protein
VGTTVTGSRPQPAPPELRHAGLRGRRVRQPGPRRLPNQRHRGTAVPSQRAGDPAPGRKICRGLPARVSPLQQGAPGALRARLTRVREAHPSPPIYYVLPRYRPQYGRELGARPSRPSRVEGTAVSASPAQYDREYIQPRACSATSIFSTSMFGGSARPGHISTRIYRANPRGGARELRA